MFSVHRLYLWSGKGLTRHSVPVAWHAPGTHGLSLLNEVGGHNEKKKNQSNSQTPTMVFVHRSAAVDPEECCLFKGNFFF